MSRLVQRIARRTAGLLGRESRLIRSLRPAYESALDWLGGGRGIPWPINGVTYRIDPHQRPLLGQAYEPAVAAFLRERVQPGAVCLDVGANVGAYVLQCAHWSQPGGRVVAFEPNPGACAVLQNHIRLNGLEERVEVVPAAVGAESGQAVFYAVAADPMSRAGAPNEAIADRVASLQVPVLTLDDFCQTRGLLPDWLIIDIEGFELAALQGARRLLASRKNALGIVVEMHPALWASACMTRGLVETALADLGLRAVPLTGQADPLGEYGHVHLVAR
jgi:FkbM family methyltransferase